MNMKTTATPFDPIKAIKEEIAGLGSMITVIKSQATAAELQMAEAEARFNALKNIEGFATAEIRRKREVLAQLEEQAK